MADGGTGRLAAVVLILGAVASFIWMASLDARAAWSERVELERVVAGLQESLARPQRRSLNAASYALSDIAVTDESADQALLSLQELARDAIVGGEGRLLTLRDAGRRELADDAVVVLVEVRFDGDLVALSRTLAALDAARPLVIIDRLSVEEQRGLRAGGNITVSYVLGRVIMRERAG